FMESLQNGTAIQPIGVGPLLRRWREARHLSQLELALEAEVSARHICFLETGRAEPSRAMLLTLAKVLDVPLREQNYLLMAAGFADLRRDGSGRSADDAGAHCGRNNPEKQRAAQCLCARSSLEHRDGQSCFH